MVGRARFGARTNLVMWMAPGKKCLPWVLLLRLAAAKELAAVLLLAGPSLTPRLRRRRGSVHSPIGVPRHADSAVTDQHVL